MKYLFYTCCNCGYELRLGVELAGAKMDARGPSPIYAAHAAFAAAIAMEQASPRAGRAISTRATFDLIHLAIRRAVARFGGSDKIFNAAGFAQAFRQLANVDNLLDGKEVEVILCGRRDVVQLSGGAHYQLIETNLADDCQRIANPRCGGSTPPDASD